MGVPLVQQQQLCTSSSHKRSNDKKMATDFDRCLELREEEILALSSIYEDSFMQVSENSFEIQIVCEHDGWWSMTVRITLPLAYPQTERPFYEVFSECLTDEDFVDINNGMDEVWDEYKGECMLFVWIEKCKNILLERKETSPQYKEKNLTKSNEIHFMACKSLESNGNESIPEKVSINKDLDNRTASEKYQSNEHSKGYITEELHTIEADLPEIISGETIVDRKSIFQGHAAFVESEEEVTKVMQKLKENRKIARATHNIMAYRIIGSKQGTFLQDCDDDGENEAGGRLMHLLQILDAKNVVVIVSRWYGGILLGPDRFKHINNCARDVIVRSGIFTEVKEEKHATRSKKKGKKNK